MINDEKFVKLNIAKNKVYVSAEKIESQYILLKKYIENIDFSNKNRGFIDFFEGEMEYSSNVMNSLKLSEDEFDNAFMNEINRLDDDVEETDTEEIVDGRENSNR